MKTKFMLFYDQECPFCQWYSQKLVDFKFITSDGRKTYQNQITAFSDKIDLVRAKNQLACFNPVTEETKYGMDGLLAIIGQKMPILEKFLRFYPIYLLLLTLYSLISFNRKVIFPGKNKAIGCACEPQQSWLWRVIFILILSGITGILVDKYFKTYMLDYLTKYRINDVYLLMCQLLFQSLAFILLKQRNWYDYIGNLVLVSFIGAISLCLIQWTLLVVGFYFNTTFLAEAGYGATLLLMFNLHKTRLKQHNWTAWLSLSWIIFRLVIYPLVFKL